MAKGFWIRVKGAVCQHKPACSAQGSRVPWLPKPWRQRFVWHMHSGTIFFQQGAKRNWSAITLWRAKQVKTVENGEAGGGGGVEDKRGAETGVKTGEDIARRNLECCDAFAFVHAAFLRQNTPAPSASPLWGPQRRLHTPRQDTVCAIFCCFTLHARVLLLFQFSAPRGGPLAKISRAQTQTCVCPNLNHNTCTCRRAMAVGTQESTRHKATVVGTVLVCAMRNMVMIGSRYIMLSLVFVDPMASFLFPAQHPRTLPATTLHNTPPLQVPRGNCSSTRSPV